MNQLPFCACCSPESPCVFRTLDSHELLDVFSVSRPLSVKRNTILYSEGFPAEGLYVLCRGNVKLSSNSDLGVHRIARMVKAGEIFGFDSILPDRIHMFTATARTSCLIHFIERKHFCNSVRTKADILWRLVTVLNEGLHRSEQVRLATSGDCAGARLYNAIVLLSEPQKTLRTLQGSRSLTLRQTELSELIGISPETVSREMRKLRKKGLVTVKRGTILITPRSRAAA